MIKNIFLPEKIGNYYLFSKRIIGVDIGRTHITATQLRLSGNSTRLEKCIEEQLEIGNSANHTERVVEALKAIFARLDQFDEVRASLSSTFVVFKELKLPFLSYDKIKMVLNFEIEPLLPFASETAVIDFIVTQQHIDEKSSEILVAAVQKQHIIQHLALYERAGIRPDVITIDMFSLYGLYKKIPSYAALQNSVVLLDIGLHSTRIAHIDNGQLRSIRALSKGVFTITKVASEKLGLLPNQVLEQIIRFGIEKTDDETFTDAIKESLGVFWKDVRFTFDSFIAQSTTQEPIAKILLLGGGAQIKGIAQFVSDLFSIDTELFSVAEIIDNKMMQVKNKQNITSTAIISLSCALPTPVSQEFNLIKDEFKISKSGFIIKQILVSLVLSIGIITSLLVYTMIQTNTLRHELQQSQEDAIETLRERFTKITEENDLDEAIDIAREELRKEELTWFAFSGPARASFLKYLLELTNIIDKESLGFTVDQIMISGDQMILKAQVKDYPELKLLEHELAASKLFKEIPLQDDPSNIEMRINLVQNGDNA